MESFDCVIVGAGWAGLGVAASLKSSGVTNFRVLEKGNCVGFFWSQLYDCKPFLCTIRNQATFLNFVGTFYSKFNIFVWFSEIRQILLSGFSHVADSTCD